MSDNSRNTLYINRLDLRDSSVLGLPHVAANSPVRALGRPEWKAYDGKGHWPHLREEIGRQVRWRGPRGHRGAMGRLGTGRGNRPKAQATHRAGLGTGK